MVYTGQTGRSFKKRMIKNQINESNNFTYVDYSMEFGHQFNHNFDVLHNEVRALCLSFLALETDRYNYRNILLNDRCKWIPTSEHVHSTENSLPVCDIKLIFVLTLELKFFDLM